jgi:hypothetical protein
MANTISAIGSLIRGLAMLGFVVLFGTGGVIAYQAYQRHFQLEEQLRTQADQIAERDSRIKELGQEVDDLNLALRLLKVDHRLAEIRVLDQTKNDDGKITTKLQFVEVGDDGKPIDAPRELTIDGDLAYIDAWVVKYHDKLVESGNPLGATSVCLFRRIFGETQKPADGFPLDRNGEQPIVYRHGEQVTDRERQIWSQFWDYANNPTLAEQAGVRAAHGEAPSIKLRPGKLYRLELRASGGLTIVPEDAPEKAPAI